MTTCGATGCPPPPGRSRCTCGPTGLSSPSSTAPGRHHPSSGSAEPGNRPPSAPAPGRAAGGAPGDRSRPFPGLVDLLGEVFQGLGAFLEPPFGHGGAGRPEQVPGPDRAVPAAEPVQALLLLIQLGQRQLPLGDL